MCAYFPLKKHKHFDFALSILIYFKKVWIPIRGISATPPILLSGPNSLILKSFSSFYFMKMFIKLQPTISPSMLICRKETICLLKRQCVILFNISGDLFSVNPKALKSINGIFNFNERVLLSGRWEHGPFLYAAVGAYNVGSIKLDNPIDKVFVLYVIENQ